MDRLQFPSEGESDVTVFVDGVDANLFRGITLDWLIANSILISTTMKDKYMFWRTADYLFYGPLPRQIAFEIRSVSLALEAKGAEVAVARIDETKKDSYFVYRNVFPYIAPKPFNLRIGGLFRSVKRAFANTPPVQSFARFLRSLMSRTVPRDEPEFGVLQRDSKRLYRIFLEQFLHGIGPAGLQGVYYVASEEITKFVFFPMETEQLRSTEVDPTRESVDSFFFPDSIGKKERTIWRNALGTFATTIFKKRCETDSGDAKVEAVKRQICATYVLKKLPKEKERETYGGMESVIDIETTTLPEDIFAARIRLGRTNVQDFLVYDTEEGMMKVSPTVHQVILRNIIQREEKEQMQAEETPTTDLGGMQQIGKDVFTFSSDPSDRTNKFFTLDSMLDNLLLYTRKSAEAEALSSLAEIWRLREIDRKVIPPILNMISSVALKDLDPTLVANRKLTTYILNLTSAFNNEKKDTISFTGLVSIVSRTCNAKKGRPHCILDYERGIVLTTLDEERLRELERRIKAKDALFISKVGQITRTEEIKESEDGEKYTKYFKMLCYLLHERDEECYTWLNYYFSTNELETKYITPDPKRSTAVNVLFDVLAHVLGRDVVAMKTFYKRRNYYYLVYLIYIALQNYKQDLIDVSQKPEDLERAAEYASVMRTDKYGFPEEDFLSYKKVTNLDLKLRYWASSFSSDVDITDSYFSDLDAMNKDITFV